MRKVGIVILCISIIANILLGILYLKHADQNVPDVEKYVSKIDSLEHNITNIDKSRDSIRLKIDTVYTSIKNNNIQYEKTRDSILSFSVNDDYFYFTSYLKWNRQRLNSVDNLEPAQGN